MIAAALLVTHLDYSRDASMLLLDAVAALPPEEQERDRGASHGGLLGTLRHVFFADRIWLSRLQGAPRFVLADPGESPTAEKLREAWPALLDEFKAQVTAFGDAGVVETFDFVNLAGKAFRMPRWQALLHVVNHGTLHRGQVMGMLRQMGVPPPATDLIYYYQR